MWGWARGAQQALCALTAAHALNQVGAVDADGQALLPVFHPGDEIAPWEKEAEEKLELAQAEG